MIFLLGLFSFHPLKAFQSENEFLFLNSRPSFYQNQVEKASPVILEFNAIPDVRSLNERSVIIEGLQSGPVRGKREISDQSIVFLPDADYPAGERIRVTITSALSDDKGNAIKNPISFYFTVESQPTLGGFTKVIVDTSARRAEYIQAADVNQDRRMDLLIATEGDSLQNGTFLWYENKGDYVFEKHILDNDFFGGRSIQAADLNRDGKLDIIASFFEVKRENNLLIPGTSEVRAYLQDRDGAFQKTTIDSRAEGAFSVYPNDMDRDGRIDILIASQEIDSINSYWNAESSGFVFHKLQLPQQRRLEKPLSVEGEDLNQDGLPDLLIATSKNDGLIWMQQDTIPFQFLPPQIIDQNTVTTNETFFVHAHAADMDGDKFPDLLAASRDNNLLNLYFNDPNAPGNFSDANIVDADAQGIRHLSTGDLDGDGDLDIVAALKGLEAFRWYRNEGEALNFSAQTIDEDALGAQWVQTSDIDQDGDLDIVSVTRRGNTVAIYVNDIQRIIGNSRVCLGFTETYEVNFLPNNQYRWEIAGGEIIQEENLRIEVDWNQPGTGKIQLLVFDTDTMGFVEVRNLEIEILRPDSIRLTGPQSICQNQTQALYQSNRPVDWLIEGGFIVSDTSGPSTEVRVFWQEDSEKRVIAISRNAENTCLSSDTLRVNMREEIPRPVISIWPDPLLHCRDASTYLTFQSDISGTEVRWFREGETNPLSSKDTLLLEESGVYFLEINTECEMIRSDPLTISLPEVFIPELFSPNGDGQNDYFNVCTGGGGEVDALQLKVLDRWGNTVYFTDRVSEGLCQPNPSQDRGWDGGIHPNGVYFWDLAIRFRGCDWEKYMGKIALRR